MSQTSQKFLDWCLECVEQARGHATLSGTNIEAAMFRILPVIMTATKARFPEIDLNVALRELSWWAVKADRDDAESQESRKLERSWKDWCNDCVEKACRDAVKHGMTVEEVMLRTLHLYVNEIRDMFPSVDLGKALDDLGSLARAADREGSSDPAQGPMPRKTWEEWCRECVEEAREYATQNGTPIETAMLRILSMFIDETMARFPKMELSTAVKELAWYAGKADHDARLKSE